MGEETQPQIITKTNSPSWGKGRNDFPCEGQYTQQTQQSDCHTQEFPAVRERAPIMDEWWWEKHPGAQNREGEHTQAKIVKVKQPPNIPLREEKKNLDVCPNGHAFWVLTCPKSQKRFSQIWISDFHTLPIPCNNYFNQFLAELNDWLNETRKVVDNLMGSFIDIWIFPIGPKR